MSYKIFSATLNEAKQIHAQIPEFNYTNSELDSRSHFKDFLVLIAKDQDSKSLGYMISYDRYNDGSYYCLKRK